MLRNEMYYELGHIENPDGVIFDVRFNNFFFSIGGDLIYSCVLYAIK